MPSFDTIIVGGGSAGCVMANRLSARSGRSVLLLEAGRDTPPGKEPADVLDIYPTSYYNRSYMWPAQRAHWRRRDNSPSVPLDQGRILGGGSTVMGMVALRGTPDDYDEWERLGAAGWGFAGVLPYFRKLESDLDFRNDMHGSDGPTPIRRVGRDAWTPVAHAAAEFAASRQMPHVADMNGDFRDGYGSLPMSNTLTRRASTAICYLDTAVRRRSNLTIVTSAQVSELLLEDRRAVGVRAVADGEEREFRGGEIILCGGGIFSPAMLMQAGIGPAEHLRELGIRVRADLPGVGRNMQNHPAMFIGVHLRRAGRQPPSLRSLQVSSFRLSSGLPGCPATDVFIHLQSKSSWNALGQQIGNFGPTLWKPFSRGRVSLTSAEPREPPLVEFNFVDDERDLRRLMFGLRFAAEFLASAPMRDLCGRRFPVRFTDRLRRLNQTTTVNALGAAMVARLVDLSPWLADQILASLTGGAGSIAELVADDAALAEHVRNNVAGTFHVTTTCRMGTDDDPDAVVDAAGRVRHIGHLRVADASVMPSVPRANTNIPTIMVAEKLADTIDQGGAK